MKEQGELMQDEVGEGHMERVQVLWGGGGEGSAAAKVAQVAPVDGGGGVGKPLGRCSANMWHSGKEITKGLGVKEREEVRGRGREQSGGERRVEKDNVKGGASLSDKAKVGVSENGGAGGWSA